LKAAKNYFFHRREIYFFATYNFFSVTV